MIKKIYREKITEDFNDNKTIQAQSSEAISGGVRGNARYGLCKAYCRNTRTRFISWT